MLQYLRRYQLPVSQADALAMAFLLSVGLIKIAEFTVWLTEEGFNENIFAYKNNNRLRFDAGVLVDRPTYIEYSTGQFAFTIDAGQFPNPNLTFMDAGTFNG